MVLHFVSFISIHLRHGEIYLAPHHGRRTNKTEALHCDIRIGMDAKQRDGGEKYENP